MKSPVALFKGLFSGTKVIDHGGNPQYLSKDAGVSRMSRNGNYPGSHNPNFKIRTAKTSLNEGLHEGETAKFELHYQHREQPDLGGALDYAYCNYGLPLDNVAGPWMVARRPFRPYGSPPLAFFAVQVPTSVGGLIPGQIISQPLLDPRGPGYGYDIYS